MSSRLRFNLEIFGERAALEEYRAGAGNRSYLDHLTRQLRRAIDEVLSEPQRLAVSAFYFEGRSVTEIAAILGVNKSTVSRNLSRAKRRLGAALRFVEPYSSDG